MQPAQRLDAFPDFPKERLRRDDPRCDRVNVRSDADWLALAIVGLLGHFGPRGLSRLGRLGD